ncbi:MAG: cupin domain-containing protein [Microbacteriaceae bacterium]
MTLLDVYDDAGPDGLVGGSPHMHLASTECYVVIGGRGALHTLDLSGARETPLEAGSVVWFTPGTIHRAVNHGGLQVLVIMGNAGLPEAGDAVMTFPTDVVADPSAYREAATLPARDSLDERVTDAARRRDLAVEGFLRLRAALDAGDDAPLRAFYDAAAAVVRDRAAGWEEIVARGPLAQAQGSVDVVRLLAAGDAGHLASASLESAPPLPDERGFGMCGRLRAYDVGGTREPA